MKLIRKKLILIANIKKMNDDEIFEEFFFIINLVNL